MFPISFAIDYVLSCSVVIYSISCVSYLWLHSCTCNERQNLPRNTRLLVLNSFWYVQLKKTVYCLLQCMAPQCSLLYITAN